MRPYYHYGDDHGGQRVSFRVGWTRTIKVLIVVNALAFLVIELLRGRFGFAVDEWVGFYRPFFLSGAAWQVVSYMFVHAGLGHLLMNMLGLFFFGGDVERQLGRASFLTMYFACGIGGALLSLYQEAVPIIGASGGVLGVLVAFAMLFPHARILVFLIIPVRARYIAILYAFITVASLLGGSHGNTAHLAHLGGMVVAFAYVQFRLDRFLVPIFLMPVALFRALSEGIKAERMERRERRTEAEQAELDRILEKIHEEGITALSNQERDFLNLMSRKNRDG